MKVLMQQFVAFCGVGVINTVVGLAVILGLSEVAGVEYRLANVLGYAAGLCVGFTLNRRFTFADAAKKGRISGQAAGFIAVFAVSYLCQFLVLVGLVDRFGMSNMIAQVIACGAYTAISFIGNRFFTFRTS